ncbi:SCO family protein [Calidifontimicrobium sp. SYSU G02091]|uniref:SCO family protein n=1 Tax=Calidifontimicrobium sp. SYSU G02091 TaxID=2926421 RepID=UPI001F53226E|nr:SCO family protein [Calidifontimicrobium sp. SYSU G02091]MCI1191020.1 SCO family protein [Calidifontimicrobium sp. SYSU G02091]
MTAGASAARAGAAALLALAAGSAPAAQYEPGKGLVARPQQDFVAPAPGTYRLPPIQQAADGWVLDGDWLPRRLSRYTRGALTLLSFVYTYCIDPIGCPLAFETFVDLRERVRADPLLKGRVRLVSLSFDPTHDTPAQMQLYGGAYARDRDVPWAFLTTYSVRFLKPILDGFGQDVEVELDADGQPTRTLTHLLKVFLIDERGRVREIYSAAFLQPEVMLNDLRTLALESAVRRR